MKQQVSFRSSEFKKEKTICGVVRNRRNKESQLEISCNIREVEIVEGMRSVNSIRVKSNNVVY